MIRILTFLLSCLLCSNCAAQDKITTNVYKLNGITPQEAEISDFSMLEGDWSGTGLGGECDELWLPARQNQMHGIFRMEQEGKLIFTEYMSILKDSISFIMKIKHFTPEFDGWEEKDEATEFRFIKKEKNTLYFSGLTATLVDKNHLNIYVAFKEDENTTEELFAFKKK